MVAITIIIAASTSIGAGLGVINGASMIYKNIKQWYRGFQYHTITINYDLKNQFIALLTLCDEYYIQNIKNIKSVTVYPTDKPDKVFRIPKHIFMYNNLYIEPEIDHKGTVFCFNIIAHSHDYIEYISFLSSKIKMPGMSTNSDSVSQFNFYQKQVKPKIINNCGQKMVFELNESYFSIANVEDPIDLK